MKIERIRKNEALLWFGSWTSRIGNLIFDYANSVSIVGAFTGKPWVLAAYQSSETVIQIVFNLIGGARADKGDRKKIVIITDLLAALICGVLSFFVKSRFMAEVMIVANALLSLVYAFNSPTYKSLIREVVERERIGFFNGISHAGGELIRVIGPIVGVGLVGVIGVRGALLFDAFTFAASAAAEALLTKIDGCAASGKGGKKLLTDIAEGFGYLAKEKRILFLVILSSLVNFFLAGYNLLLPYTDLIFRDFADAFYSKALAMEALGGIIGSALFAKRINRFRDNVLALILFLFGTGFVLALLPLLARSGQFVLCLLPFALFGVSLTAFNIQFMSYVQVAVNENYLGRVFSIIFTVAVLFMPLGSFLLSKLLNTADVASYYVVGGGIVLLSLASVPVHFANKRGTVPAGDQSALDRAE